jgi:hypothetical protein
MKIFSTFAVVLAGGASLCSVSAAAESTTCADSYEKAQEERVAGHLNAALVHLKNCIDPSCPKFVRDDCVRWMDQTESALPTVVFAVRREGKDLTDVQVSCDGKPLLSSLDGKAVPVDPGLHDFRFNVPGRDPVQQQTIIREGERNRIIEVKVGTPQEGDASPKPTADAADLLAKSGERGMVMRYLPYGMAGLAVLGAAGFALFAIEGSNQRGELERSCSPYCRASQVDDVKTKYALADTCLAVGLVSAGVATYLFLTRHGEKTERHDQTTSVGFAPRSSGVGGVLQVSTPF